jgi:L-ascorbate metabolism protein UlaG (beta-lactamase superfamily)
MEITWYGHSCFRVTERSLPTIVSDPYDHGSVGFKALKLKADIVTVSHDAPGHSFVQGVKGSEWEIRGPGEYEIGGIFITGVATNEGKKDRNVVYVYEYDGVTIGHLGDMDKVPTRTQVEAFGTVDVLLVPVGGGNALSSAKAVEVISMIEPGLVIPMHYKVTGSSLKLNPLKPFLQEMGVSTTEAKAVPSIKVTRSTIPDETKVVVLDASV